jgi:hypothetical protein
MNQNTILNLFLSSSTKPLIFPLPISPAATCIPTHRLLETTPETTLEPGLEFAGEDARQLGWAPASSTASGQRQRNKIKRETKTLWQVGWARCLLPLERVRGRAGGRDKGKMRGFVDDGRRRFNPVF